MTVTLAIDRVTLETRILALAVEISSTGDVLEKLDLIQERYEARALLARLGDDPGGDAGDVGDAGGLVAVGNDQIVSCR
jgi:hypothetical protein